MYDTANRLADYAGRQKKVTIQNVRFYQTKVKIKHEFAPKLFCEKSQGNVAEAILHPI